MKKLSIWQSSTEPDKNVLWYKDGDILYFGGNGWTSLFGQNAIVQNLPASMEVCCVYKITIDSSTDTVISPVNYQDLLAALNNGYIINVAVTATPNGQEWWYPVTQIYKNGNDLELYISPGATMIQIIVKPDNTTRVVSSPAPMPIASELTLGGVRIMDGGGLLIDDEHGDLHVLKSDTYEITSSTADDTVASLKALNKLAKKLDDLIMDLHSANIETDVEVFESETI